MARGKKTGGRDIPKGVSGNPGGVSKEKRAFLDRLRDADGDAEKIYAAFMRLVDEGNVVAVVRAVEYVAGKPKETVEVQGKDGGALFALLARLPRVSAEDLETLHAIAKRVLDADGGDSAREDIPKPA